MQTDIFDFLQKLEVKGKVLPQVREMVAAEIEKYEGMRLVLSDSTENKSFTSSLLENMDRYLLNLRLVQRKLKHSHLVLLKVTPEEDPEINRKLLELLREITGK